MNLDIVQEKIGLKKTVDESEQNIIRKNRV